MAWIPVPKPTETSIIALSGDAQPFGLLIAITSVTSGPVASIVSGWTGIAKPATASWVAVAKPTMSPWTPIAKPNS